MVVLDYYDGPTSGFLQCAECEVSYYFYMLDWDVSQMVRVFALSSMPHDSLERVYSLLGARPDRRVWIPPLLSRATEEQLSALYDGGLQETIDRAAAPEFVVAWSVDGEKILALRGIDASTASHLSPWFDRQRGSDAFDWFGYLGLGELCHA